MRYGYFDDQRKEYVIERPDTPMSWINYLGAADYCAIISNNASGYSFYRSPRSGRMLRFRFNSIPMDRPGRYIYLKDHQSGDYWSATWQPVGKPLEEYRSVCRHGLGYTCFESEYDGIKTNHRVFVPVDRPLEVWEIEVENLSGQERDLSLFPYAEWCFWRIDQDLINFQYILYTCRMGYDGDGIIDYTLRWPGGEEDKGFMASVLPVTGFDTDREVFLGPYRDEGRPLAVEKGACANSIAIGGNACAVLQNRFVLAPGAKKRAVFVVGVGDARTTGRETRDYYARPEAVAKDFAVLQEYWAKRLANYRCKTPSPVVDTMVNIWNQYQCHTTFNWSRSASFNEAGGRDGIGYRDTNQDTLGVVHAIPELVREKLLVLLTGQLAEGYAMHGFQPLSWNQGPHNIPEPGRIFSDDHLWLLLSVSAYIKETGDFAILDEVAPFADEGETTVYEHLRRALEFSWQKRGPHGLLLGLAADWNDCINLKGKGESIWSTFLYYRALSDFIELARRRGQDADVKLFTGRRDEIKNNLDTHAWDGEWFLRGYLDSGRKLGGRESEQSKIFLNTQSWAVFSGAYTGEKARLALDSMHRYLVTEHGIVLNHPAYRETDNEIGAITSFPAGLKENAGIFCHANTWAVIAECLLGRGDKAFALYTSFLPAAKNDRADLYTMEPYVYAQFITGIDHPYYFGRARNSWLTGTAAWSFVAVSQYILGVRPDYDGLVINPCIPAEWDGFEVTRICRGKIFRIKVKNPHRTGYGVKELKVNGRALPGNLIPYAEAAAENEVEVTLG